MRAVLSSLVFMALAASSYVTAEGINCEGSSECLLFLNPPLADSLRQQVDQVDDNRVFQNGEHIACVKGNGAEAAVGSICAFLQNTGGLPGSAIKTLAQRIIEHGCNNCGSVPVFFDQGDNDVNTHGELTFNFVSGL